jgi:tetratricopeptide (TPR) repeat protein
VPDYGLDYTVEVFDEARHATPYSFHAQLKATDEPDLTKALNSVRFEREWAEHYWSLPLPVLIVRFHTPSEQLFARWFHAYNPHVALRQERETPTKTIGFRFTGADARTEATSAELEAAVKAFMHFRSPEIELPLRFRASSEQGVDVLPNVFALRAALAPVSEIALVETGPAGPDRPHITVGELSSTVALADVASVTLDYAEDVSRDATTDAANIATAIALVLTRVGQSNLAAQIAAACASASTTILNYDVAFSLAQAFYRARRTMEALKLADAINARDDPDARFSAFLLQTAVLARGSRLTSDETQLAIEVSRESLGRSEARGDLGAAAGDAYNLGQALRRARDGADAIAAYRKAAELDPSYEDRAYFNSELAGILFESGHFEESAERYGRALERGADPFIEALLADALLWSGHYDDAGDSLTRYLRNKERARDAEWRLKRRALVIIRETAGGWQDRQPDRASALIEPFDFESGEDWNPEEGLEAFVEALRVDACCAEAWFRLGLLTLALSDPPDVQAAFENTLVSAVLHRQSPGAWNNAIRLLRAGDLPDDVARDCLHMAYRFCGPSIADKLQESEDESDAPPDPQLFPMLNEVMQEVDDEERPQSFTLRIPDPGGGMTEVSFVTEIPPNPTETAHDPLADS